MGQKKVRRKRMIKLTYSSSKHGRSHTKLLEQVTFSPASLIFHLHSLIIISFDSKDNAVSLRGSSY